MPSSVCLLFHDPTEPANNVVERDEKEAIDKSNIMDDRTRHATKSAETYQEPGDREGLPENNGKSAIAQ